VRFQQRQVLLLHYLALAEDGALPAGRVAAAWARLPKPPYCDVLCATSLSACVAQSS
jgi:hypothetical protein